MHIYYLNKNYVFQKLYCFHILVYMIVRYLFHTLFYVLDYISVIIMNYLPGYVGFNTFLGP